MVKRSPASVASVFSEPVTTLMRTAANTPSALARISCSPTSVGYHLPLDMSKSSVESTPSMVQLTATNGMTFPYESVKLGSNSKNESAATSVPLSGKMMNANRPGSTISSY